MTINANPQLTFGVEMELVQFWNGTPIKVHIGAELINDDTDKRTSGRVIFNRERLDAEICIDQFLSAKITDNRANVIQVLELDSLGNICPPWKVTGLDWLSENRDAENGVLDQTRKLLAENNLHNWKVMEEESINGSGVDAVEIASPVLQMGDLDSIEQACSIFSPITTVDESCGVHVHIGIANAAFEHEYLQRLVEAWIEIEPSLLELPFYQKKGSQNGLLVWETDSRRDPGPILDKIWKSTNPEELSEIVNPDGKDYSLNLWSLKKYGTVEFRGFKSTTDFEIIREIIDLCEETILSLF